MEVKFWQKHGICRKYTENTGKHGITRQMTKNKENTANYIEKHGKHACNRAFRLSLFILHAGSGIRITVDKVQTDYTEA